MKKLPMTDADTVQFTSMVRKISFFASMNMGLLEKILNRITLYQYDKGEKICRQGEDGDTFYVVSEGRLRVSVREGFVFSRTLAHLGPGDCFGEMALLNRAARNATVTCEEDSKLFILMVEHFDLALKENPVFYEEIKKLAAERGLELKKR